MTLRTALAAYGAATICFIAAGTNVELRAAQAAPADKPAEERFHNIQVLKGVPASQFLNVMFYFRGSLGVTCTHCHVDFTHFEKDDNPTKAVARSMITMMRDLNEKQFGGRPVITCNTCHRGQAKPAAPLAFAEVRVEKPAPVESAPKAPPAMETALSVDQIFERYIAATGGAAQQGKLEILSMTGSISSSEGWTAPLSIYCKTPSKYLMSFDLGKDGVFSRAFNGPVAWNHDNHGVHDSSDNTSAETRQEAALFQRIALKGLYTDLTVVSTEVVDGHDAYVISAVLADVGTERLYFDRGSGLLVRITRSQLTAVGPLDAEINVKQYREWNGIKLPMVIERLAPDFSSILAISSVATDVPIDDAKFDKPPAKDGVAK